MENNCKIYEKQNICSTVMSIFWQVFIRDLSQAEAKKILTLRFVTWCIIIISHIELGTIKYLHCVRMFMLNIHVEPLNSVEW